MNGTKMREPYLYKVRVYYQDTDAGGVVYHSKYIDFSERARSDLLRSQGFSHSLLRDKYGIGIMVRALDVVFNKSAVLEDELEVKSYVTLIKNSSFSFRHEIERAGENLATINVTLVTVNPVLKRAVRIHDDLRKLLEDLKG